MYYTFKIITHIFIFLTIPIIGLCQETSFEFILESVNDEIIIDAIEDINGNFYCVGQTKNPYTPDFDTSSGILLKLNKHGKLIDSIVITEDEKSCIITDIELITQDTFLLNGFTYSFLNTGGPKYNSSIYLSKVNQNLEIFDTCYVDFADSIGFVYSEPSITFDNEILLSGCVRNGPHPESYIAFLGLHSISMDSVQYHLYTENPSFGSYSRKISDNKYFMAGFGMTSFVPYRYMFFDSAFILTEETQIEPYVNPFGIKWDTDSSFYLAGRWVENSDNNIGIIHQRSINDLSNYSSLSWGSPDTMELPARFSGIDFLNKDSIFFGGIFNGGIFDFAEIPTGFFVAQTDSLLNVRWERFYGGEAYYMMNSIVATNDNGCMLLGSRYDYKNTTELERDIYILKLNSEGLLTSTSENPKIQMHEALVFPNPGTEFLRVRIAAQYSQSTFELFDMNGNLVLKENIEGKWKQISTSFLPQGTYIYKIHNQQGLFESGKWVKQ